MIQTHKDRDTGRESWKYEAMSPDELATISGCQFFGFQFVWRPSPGTMRLGLVTKFAQDLFPWRVSNNQNKANKNNLESSKKGNDRSFSYDPENSDHSAVDLEVMNILEFDNYRKRMSVILKIPDAVRQNEKLSDDFFFQADSRD